MVAEPVILDRYLHLSLSEGRQSQAIQSQDLKTCEKRENIHCCHRFCLLNELKLTNKDEKRPSTSLLLLARIPICTYEAS